MLLLPVGVLTAATRLALLLLLLPPPVEVLTSELLALLQLPLLPPPLQRLPPLLRPTLLVLEEPVPEPPALEPELPVP